MIKTNFYLPITVKYLSPTNTKPCRYVVKRGRIKKIYDIPYDAMNVENFVEKFCEEIQDSYDYVGTQLENGSWVFVNTKND